MTALLEAVSRPSEWLHRQCVHRLSALHMISMMPSITTSGTAPLGWYPALYRPSAGWVLSVSTTDFHLSAQRLHYVPIVHDRYKVGYHPNGAVPNVVINGVTENMRKAEGRLQALRM